VDPVTGVQPLSPLATAALVGVGGVLFLVVFAVAFSYVYRRHRVFRRGLRGTGRVLEVRGTRVMERRSVTERPTVRVVVATAAVPGGVLTDQKLPAGEYQPGQEVPVVQDPRDPRRLYVDRPDLERPGFLVGAMATGLVIFPLVLVRGLVLVLAGG
jgi:hypothetical protein